MGLTFGFTNGVPAFQRTMDSIVESEKLDTFPCLDNITVGAVFLICKPWPTGGP